MGAFLKTGDIYRGNSESPVMAEVHTIRTDSEDMTDKTDRDIAREHKEQGNWEAAVSGYDRACAVDPGDLSLFFERGCVKLEKGDFSEADEDLSKVLSHRPQDLNALFNRGICRLRLTMYADAREDFSAFLQQFSDDAEALLYRGRCHLELGQAEEAVSDFDHALQIDATLASAAFHRGRAFLSLKKWRTAICNFDKTLRLSSEYDDAYFNRAWCKGKVGDHPGAVQDFDSYLEIHPDDVESYVCRGNRYFDMGDYEHAVEDYEKATSIEQEAEQKYRALANEAEELKQFELSGSAEDLAVLFSKIGRIRLDAGETKTAVVWFNRAIGADKKYAEAWRCRGMARCQLEQFHGAILDCSQALDLDPENSQIWCDLGRTRQKLDRHEEAIAGFSRAIELNAGEAVAYLNRAFSRQTLGDREGALSDLHRAFELRPELVAQHLDTLTELEMETFQPLRESPITSQIDEIPIPDPILSAQVCQGETSPQSVETLPLVSTKQLRFVSEKVHPKKRNRLGKIASKLIREVLIAAVAILAAISLIKATDVVYTTISLVRYGIQTGNIPYHSQHCKKLYCIRTDTSPKHICGSSGRLSETFLYFCPKHQRSSNLAFLDLSLLGTMLWWVYCLSVGAMVYVCYSLAIMLVGGLFVVPLTLMFSKPCRRGVLRGLLKASAVIAVLPALISSVVYVWW
jgi:tetratricopeptide (TPR) repeat protein